MKTELTKILRTLNFADRIELSECLNLSVNLQRFCRDRKLSVNQLASELGINLNRAKKVLLGTDAYDLKMIAKIKAMQNKYLIEELNK